MKSLISIAVLFAALFAIAPGIRAESPFTITQLTDHIWQITSDEGPYTTNVLMSVGKDGVLLVDSNTEELAEDLKKVVDSIGGGTPAFIINTHRHVEHVGGNAIFGPEPIKIAHDLLPERLRGGSYLFDEFPDDVFPDITFSDSLHLNFNGETIRLIAMAGSHDDNEIIVHFTKSKVVHLSSLIYGLNFPSVDSEGDVFMFEKLVARAIELLPEDVIIVSGHNDNCNAADLPAYRDMLVQTADIVRAGLEEGKDVETLQKDSVLADFETYNKSYVSRSRWIALLAAGFEPEETKEQIFEPMYYALRDGGLERAKVVFTELRSNKADTYDVPEMALLVIGDKLVNKKRLPEAVGILGLVLTEFPNGDYEYYTRYDLAKAYKELGERDLAVEACRKSIELRPDFEAAATLLEELEKL